MAFITDKEEIKSGLIIFRQRDVAHRNFYCRIKLPKADRCKTIALDTSDPQAAREQAVDKDAEIRVLLKHDHPVFNRSFGKWWMNIWSCSSAARTRARFPPHA